MLKTCVSSRRYRTGTIKLSSGGFALVLRFLTQFPMAEGNIRLARGLSISLESILAVGCMSPNHSSSFVAGENVKFGTALMALLECELGRPKGAA